MIYKFIYINYIWTLGFHFRHVQLQVVPGWRETKHSDILLLGAACRRCHRSCCFRLLDDKGSSGVGHVAYVEL